MIHYSVSFEQARLHLFEVKLNINFALKAGQAFYLPNWIPGSYMIRDFAKNIVTLSANEKGGVVKLVKENKSTWRLTSDVTCLEICYQVYAWDLSVRSAHLDELHGFFNGTSLFLGIAGYENEAHHVQLKPSEYAQSKAWRVATAMPSREVDPQGFGKYISENYFELIDHPFEMADFESVEFEVCGVPHKMVFTEAPQSVNWPRIAKDVKQICAAEVAFFGDEKPPFDQYVFMTFVQKNGFGGLEHRASTALHCSHADLPLLGEDETKISAEYRTFLSLCCHEYFHNWNVKRIKPARFIPLDLSQEVHTELLWFFEGITSYYDELLMVRSGLITPQDYLDMLAQTITRVTLSQGRFKQSVADASFDAWTKFYKQDEGSVNNIISYYTKGALVALALDFEIRKVTDSAQSLDDLMRLVWRQFGQTGKGLGESQVKLLLKELTGHSFNQFLDRALYSTQDLELEAVFAAVEVNFQLLTSYLSGEKGGFSPQLKDRKPLPSLGLVCKEDPLGAKIHSVVETSCAAMAGLSSGDVIIAVDKIRVSCKELDSVIAKYPLDSVVEFSYFRRDRLYQAECRLTAGDAGICYLSLKSEQPSAALLQWLQA